MKLEQKVIKLLADYPEREFYSQEIAEKIKCSKASASVILGRLSKKGIAFRTVRGHMKFYQVNLKNPAIKKFRISFILEALYPLLLKLQKISKKIILFGSGSRGEQTFDSDVDLLVVGNDKEKIKSVLSITKTGLPVKAIIKTPGEWSEMEVANPEFYQEVRSGITLHDYVS